MSKRFGRNQKRKMREQLQSAERVLAAAKSSYHDLVAENASLNQRLRNAIEIKVELLRDDPRRRYQARMEAHKMGHEGLYIAQQLDAQDLAMRQEQDRFIEYASREMASHLMQAIGERW